MAFLSLNCVYGSTLILKSSVTVFTKTIWGEGIPLKADHMEFAGGGHEALGLLLVY